MAYIKAVVCDSGESLLIFELKSQTNTTPPFSAPSNSRVTHSISLSCVQAPVVTYYTEVFSGNAAKVSVFDSTRVALFVSRLQSHREEIFSEFDKSCFELES